MPLKPDYEWEETPTSIIVTVKLGAFSRKDLNIFTTDRYVSLNCAPHLLQLDLWGDVDASKSVAAIEDRTITLTLPKANAGLWGTLLFAGNKEDTKARRQQSIELHAKRVQEEQEAKRKAKDSADKLAVEQQMKQDRERRNLIEERKQRELQEERDEIARWQQGGTKGLPPPGSPSTHPPSMNGTTAHRSGQAAGAEASGTKSRDGASSVNRANEALVPPRVSNDTSCRRKHQKKDDVDSDDEEEGDEDAGRDGAGADEPGPQRRDAEKGSLSGHGGGGAAGNPVGVSKGNGLLGGIEEAEEEEEKEEGEEEEEEQEEEVKYIPPVRGGIRIFEEEDVVEPEATATKPTSSAGRNSTNAAVANGPAEAGVSDASTRAAAGLERLKPVPRPRQTVTVPVTFTPKPLNVPARESRGEPQLSL
eukprot:jgi/Mesvir1/22920/Mv19437-RA.1